MFIYREEEHKPTDENRGIAEIIIGKQRNGPTGSREARLHQGVHALREPPGPVEELTLEDLP